MTTGMFHPHERKGTKAHNRSQSRKLARSISRMGSNPNDQVGNYAALIRVQQRPIPEASVYQTWFDSARSTKPNGKSKVTGEILRRAVRMRRNGYTVSDCERTLGGGLRHWLALLPPELAA